MGNHEYPLGTHEYPVDCEEEMNNDELIPAAKGKQLLQQLLDRPIPKPTIQRWRKSAQVKLSKINNKYFYKMEDLRLIYSMVLNLNVERSLENAYFEAFKETQGEK